MGSRNMILDVLENVDAFDDYAQVPGLVFKLIGQTLTVSDRHPIGKKLHNGNMETFIMNNKDKFVSEMYSGELTRKMRIILSDPDYKNLRYFTDSIGYADPIDLLNNFDEKVKSTSRWTKMFVTGKIQSIRTFDELISLCLKYGETSYPKELKAGINLLSKVNLQGNKNASRKFTRRYPHPGSSNS